MATLPKRPCAAHGCSELVDRGRCEAHQAQQYRDQDGRRGSRQQRGYDRQWERVRKAVLARDLYLCQICKRAGRVTEATDVDHIVPLSRGGARLDPENLQAACQRCNARKGNRQYP